MKDRRYLFLFSATALALAGCHGRDPNLRAPIVDVVSASADPAGVNLAGGARPATLTRVAASSFAAVPQASAESYPAQQQSYPAQPAQGNPAQQPAGNYGVGNSQQNEAYQYNTQAPANAPEVSPDDQAAASGAEYDAYSDLLDPDVPAADQPPPPLPADYEQPETPDEDYLWTPGYWDYASAGYYYVPGAWVAPPFVGALWTPGWWGGYGGRYRWHHGYWGQHVGYYGGINYGFGYVGFGYEGGYWNSGHFFYNTSVNRVRPGIGFVYNRPVVVSNRIYRNNSRVAYVGGPGGLRRGPAPQELAARREQRFGPMQSQVNYRREAAGNPRQFFRANNGRPQVLAAPRGLPADRGGTNGFNRGPDRGGNNGAPGGFNQGSDRGPSNGFNRGPSGAPGSDPRSNGLTNGPQNGGPGRPAPSPIMQGRPIPNGGVTPNFGRGPEGQRPQLDGNRQQPDGQRLQFDQQRQQQMQQRQQLDQQRQQLDQQRQLGDQQRQQQMQQRQQFDQQRQQQMQQRQQMDMQRQGGDQQRQQMRQQMDQARQQMQQQRQMQQQARPAAPPQQQHFEAPHGGPPAGGGPGGGGGHRR